MAETSVRADEGKVEAIEINRASDHKLVNGGTAIGGIAGGVIGHQIGSGRGNTAATIAGALGGALVGNEIEKRQEKATRYRTTVRLASGAPSSSQTNATSACVVRGPRAGRGPAIPSDLGTGSRASPEKSGPLPCQRRNVVTTQRTRRIGTWVQSLAPHA